ncbi:MAG: SAM-dependent methyltransferase, partial [Cyanobacteria bacterium P01_H01_bin.58]
MSVQFGSLALCDVISDRIQAASEQRITFAEFMELALYYPDYGYYTARNTQLGFGGDFVTSVHLGQDFGELLAVQLLEMWHKLGCPQPFHVVEMGPGQGILAEIILSYWQTVAPECLAATHYTLVERSSSLRQVQQQRLQPLQDQGITIEWSMLAAIPQDSVVGCLFSNELVDALPVHRVVLTEAGLQEQYITTSNQENSRFQALLGDLSTPALSHYFEPLGISIESPAYPLGYTTEVNLAALPWLKQVAGKLHQGYVLTLDYGYTAQRYYSPTRSQGTLQ